jgi:hypothetical protein
LTNAVIVELETDPNEQPNPADDEQNFHAIDPSLGLILVESDEP